MQLEGPSAVQVSATWTADDDLHSTNLLCANLFRTTNALGSSMAFLTAVVGAVALQSGGRGSAQILSVVALCLGALSAWYYDTARRVRRHRRMHHSSAGKEADVYGLDHRGVHWEGAEGNSFTRWKAVVAFTETPRFWRFETKEGFSVMIPRAGLTPTDDAAVDAAMKLFADKIGRTD